MNTLVIILKIIVIFQKNLNIFDPTSHNTTSHNLS